MVTHSVGEIAEVTWATCLDEASTLLKQQEFSLVILDIELPDGDGIEFCSRLKPTHPKTPVLFITSHTTLLEKKLAFTNGADGFMTKPFSPGALREKISEVGKDEDMGNLLEFYLVG